jgi:hypothetical protein
MRCTLLLVLVVACVGDPDPVVDFKSSKLTITVNDWSHPYPNLGPPDLRVWLSKYDPSQHDLEPSCCWSGIARID